MPRPFYLALGLALLVILLLRKRSTTRAALTAPGAGKLEPAQEGKTYPASIKPLRVSSVRAADPGRPVDPQATGQEDQEIIGTAWADGSYTPAGLTRADISPDGVIGYDW